MNTNRNKANRNRTVKIILTAAAFFILAAAAVYYLWKSGAFLPRQIRWEDTSFVDHTGDYLIELNHKAVTVTWQGSLAGPDSLPGQGGTSGQDDSPEHAGVIWTSPTGVKVQKALSADVDNDGREELVLLCWKIGRYGRDRPFWVEKDERKWSQHLFVYDYIHGEIRPKWMSSYLGKDLADIHVYQRSDCQNRLLFTDFNGETTCWKWDSWGFTLEDAAVSFLAFGDNLIHEPIYRYGLQDDGDFSFLYENFTELISASDVSVINQETPLVDHPGLYSDYPRFGTPLQVGEAIADAGFDVVTCATNHALDKGTHGINTTKKFFQSRDIICLGIQAEDEKEYRPFEILTKKGIRFALLNYTYGTNGLSIPAGSPYMVHLLEDEEKIRQDIEAARAESDFCILFVHWGTENSALPDEYQEKWTRFFLDNHVDIVIGTHPHALQPMELLRAEDGHEMLIFYSIGNFISAQSARTGIKGGMASFTVSPSADGYKITEYALTPLSITWHKGGKYTVDQALTPYPDPESFSSNSASGTGLE